MNDIYRSPGYYPDPRNPGMERWWNGNDWSDSWRPNAPSMPQGTGPTHLPGMPSAPPPPPPKPVLPQDLDPQEQLNARAAAFINAVESPDAPGTDVGKLAAGMKAADVPGLISQLSPPRPAGAPEQTHRGWAWKPAILTFLISSGLFIVSFTVPFIIGAAYADSDGSFSLSGTPAMIAAISLFIALISFFGAIPAAVIAGIVGGRLGYSPAPPFRKQP